MWKVLGSVVWLTLALVSVTLGVAHAQTFGEFTPIAAAPEVSTRAFGVTLTVAGSNYIALYADDSAEDGFLRGMVLAGDGSTATLLPRPIPSMHRVACSDSECVGVVRDLPLDMSRPAEVRIVRFRTTGEVIDATPLTVASFPSARGLEVAVGRVGSSFAIAYWVQTDTLTEVTFTPVSFATGPLASTRVSTAGSPLSSILACLADRCLLGWQEGPQARFVRLSPDGTLLDAAPIDVSVLAYSIEAAGSEWAVFGTERFRVSPSGVVGPLTVTAPTAPRVGCAGSGTCYSLGTFPSGDRYVDRWESSGFTDSVPVSGLPLGPSQVLELVCRAPSDCAMLERSLSGERHWVTRVEIVSATEAQLTRMPELGRAPELHEGPLLVVASDLATVGFFHRRDRDFVSDLRAAPLDSDGRPAGSAVTVRSQMEAFDIVGLEDGFALVYQESGELWFQRLDVSGAPAEAPYRLGPGQAPSLAREGTDVLLTYSDTTSARWLHWRFNSQGERVDTAPRLLSAPYHVAMDVAGSNGAFLAVGAGASGLRAARVARDGTALDPSGILVRDTAVSGAQVIATSVGWLIAWAEAGPGGVLAEVRLARIALDGTNADPGGRVLGAPVGRIWSARDGEAFIIASLDAGGVRVQTYDATTLEPLGAGDVTDCGNRCNDVTLGGSPLMVAVEGVVLESTRTGVLVSRVLDDALGAGCASDAECASGFCTGGTCCDARCDGACELCMAGRCEPAPATTTCRVSASLCDAPEVCDGTTRSCPADLPTECDAGAPSDAGVDGGTVFDANAPADGGPAVAAGGCAVGGGSSSSLSLLVFALLVLRVRRRTGPRQSDSRSLSASLRLRCGHQGFMRAVAPSTIGRSIGPA